MSRLALLIHCQSGAAVTASLLIIGAQIARADDLAPPTPTLPVPAVSAPATSSPPDSTAATINPTPYPLSAAVADALARNPAISAAGADRTTAGLLRETAEWSRYPTLSVEVAPGVYNSGPAAAGSTRSVRIDQPLWSGGRISGQIASARAQETSATSAESEARRAVAEQTAVSYLGWVGSSQRLQIAIAGRTVFEKLLAYVQHRERVGAAALSDVSVAQARLAAVAVQREQLQGELDHALSEVRSLVAGPVGTPVPQAVPPATTTDGELAEQAYVDHSNTLAQRQADIDAAVAGAQAQRGEASPQLLLRLERSSSNVNGFSVPAQNRVGFALDFTPQPGLAAFSAIRAAQSRIVAARERLRSEDLDVRLRARTHVADFLSAERQLVELRPQIDELRTTAESYMRQFEAGKRTWIDVLNAYREQLDAQVNLSRAQTQRDQNALHLMANTGALLSWIDSPRP